MGLAYHITCPAHTNTHMDACSTHYLPTTLSVPVGIVRAGDPAEAHTRPLPARTPHAASGPHAHMESAERCVLRATLECVEGVFATLCFQLAGV